MYFERDVHTTKTKDFKKLHKKDVPRNKINEYPLKIDGLV